MLNAARRQNNHWLWVYKPIANAVWATPYEQSKVEKANCIKHIVKGLMNETHWAMQQVICRKQTAERWMYAHKPIGFGFYKPC